MYIDPGERMVEDWGRVILDGQSPLQMLDFFNNYASRFLDTASITHIINQQGHLVRKHFLFALMAVWQSKKWTQKYIIAVNDYEYFMRNLKCAQSVNSSLEYEQEGNLIFLSPLPIIFKIGVFPDCRSYRIPGVLGGSDYAYDVFSGVLSHDFA